MYRAFLQPVTEFVVAALLASVRGAHCPCSFCGRLFFLFSLLLLSTAAKASWIDSPIWINELHYDNVGADKSEMVEIAAPTSFSDLSSVTLTLYNGSNGSTYGTPTTLDAFTRGETSRGIVFYTLEVALQNGAPDGLALTHGPQVLQFLSYEGTFTATNGPAAGLLSTDINVLETTSTPLGSSLQLGGTGNSYGDFSWQPVAPGTPGRSNHGQTAVPEPAALSLWLLAAFSLGLLWHRSRSRGRKPSVVRRVGA